MFGKALGLLYPEDLFDAHFFRENPAPFYKFARRVCLLRCLYIEICLFSHFRLNILLTKDTSLSSRIMANRKKNTTVILSIWHDQ
jgi:NAD-dependent SIR2 family protein deacetylase